MRVRDRLVALVSTLPGVTVEGGYGHTGFHLRGRRIAWLLVDHHATGRLAVYDAAPGVPGTETSR